jgi:hypothetical protein
MQIQCKSLTDPTIMKDSQEIVDKAKSIYEIASKIVINYENTLVNQLIQYFYDSQIYLQRFQYSDYNFGGATQDCNCFV